MPERKHHEKQLRDPSGTEPASATWWPLYLLAGLALLFGLWGRLKGLATAPLTSDEYYLVRSADNILRTGLPEYPCGGYYVRGLSLQYPIAWLRSLGVAPELAPRLLSVLGSLIALPLVYRLGKALAGRWLGLLALAWLAASLWEIEMARFGRMYAPFQAIFIAYLLVFIRFTRERDLRSLLAMYALTVLGVLTWEGGIFLTGLNLVPLLLANDARRRPVNAVAHAVSALVLCAAAYKYLRYPFRRLNTQAFPPDFDSSTTTMWPGAYLEPSVLSAQSLLDNPLVLVLFVAACAGAVACWPWLRGQLTRRPVTSLLLVGALVAAVAHQFLIAASLIIAPAALGWVTWAELGVRPARWYWVSLGAFLAAWLGASLSTVTWGGLDARGFLLQAGSVAYALFEYPDFFQRVLLELVRAVPILTLIGAIGIGLAIARSGTGAVPRAAPERWLLVAFLALLLAVSYIAPKNATRYVFFLYPLALLLGLAAAYGVLRARATGPETSTRIVAALAVLSFVVSGDFRPQHVWRIDSPESIYKSDLNVHVKNHLIWRTQIDTIASLLEERAVRPGDVVVSGLPGLEYYYRDIDYVFMDESEPRFLDWSCQAGAVDRWTNRPLLYTSRRLAQVVRGSHATWLVLQDGNYSQLIESTGWRPEVVFNGQRVTVARITPDELPPPGESASGR